MADLLHARQVETMSGLGIAPGDIAQLLRLAVEDLSRKFADELKDGPIKANSRVAEGLYRKATGEGPQSLTASIFWMKASAGWRETQAHEIAGADGGPVLIEETSPHRLAMAVLALLRQADAGAVERDL